MITAVVPVKETRPTEEDELDPMELPAPKAVSPAQSKVTEPEPQAVVRREPVKMTRHTSTRRDAPIRPVA